MNRQRDRLDAIRERAWAAGMSSGQIDLLLGMPPDEAERFLESQPPGRRLRDLARAERLRATCVADRCGHQGWIDLDRRRFGHIFLRELRNRLICGRCGAKGARLEIGPGWPRG